jgi:hypothetical protein
MIERAFGILMIEKKISVNTNDMSYVLYKKKKKIQAKHADFLQAYASRPCWNIPFFKKNN